MKFSECLPELEDLIEPEDLAEFYDYFSPPYLLRLQETKGMPNTSLNRSILHGALKKHRALPTTLLNGRPISSKTRHESQDWIPYKSPYISDEEADIREAFEIAKMERENRELLLIARENYDRLYKYVRDLPPMSLMDDVRVLLMPKLVEKMIEREKDYVKRFNLEFLRDSFYLWLGEEVSAEPNTNVLYYPYHMILDYQKGNEAHKTHLQNFFNDKAREVIEKRLKKAKLVTDGREYFDFTSAHPSDWHSAAHQNTPVEHEYYKPNTAYIPQFQALGNYSLGALAKGFTKPAGDGEHFICITNAYSFVNDSFDFKGIEWLGNWDLENGDFSIIRPMDMRLFNSTFQYFAERTNHGRDFRVVSPLYEIPKNELEFMGRKMIDGNICWKIKK